jgi:hypothetical protein
VNDWMHRRRKRRDRAIIQFSNDLYSCPNVDILAYMPFAGNIAAAVQQILDRIDRPSIGGGSAALLGGR